MADLTPHILCVNAGSSSLRLAVRTPHDGATVHGAVENIGAATAHMWFRDATGAKVLDETVEAPDHEHASRRALSALERLDAPPVAAAGHRIVHGGLRFVAPTPVDDALLRELRRMIDLAPLHLPAQIAGIEMLTRHAPALPQVACFDTAFHRRMPEVAQRFPLPEWVWRDGICRFGFHGLSFEHAVSVLGPGCGKVVIAHLGNGVSMAAVEGGVPVDTTMAFTPAAGLMMGTRCGDLDPGLVVHLLRERGMTPDELDRMVNRESGLLGVSGRTADMRELLGARSGDRRADLAVTMFCRSARKAVGGLAAALGGVDQLVFTGGIGEHAAPVRAEICDGLGHLGIGVDPSRNAASARVISPPGGRCVVRIITADEDGVIARHTAETASIDLPATPGPRR